MAQEKEILLKVQLDDSKVAARLGEVTVSLQQMKEQQRQVTAESKKLAAEIGDVSKATDEQKKAMSDNAKAMANLDANIKATTAEQKALQSELQSVTQVAYGQGDSFRELDAQARQLENTYKGLSAAERESAAGVELKNKLVALKEQLKTMDAELGNHQRNVGNYAQSIGEAFGGLPGPMGRAGKGVKNLTAQFKIMSTTPVIAIIGLIAALFQALWEQLHKSEEGMNAMSETMAAFGGIATIIQKVVDVLAKSIVWLAKQISRVVEYFTDLNETMKESKRLAEEEIEITKMQRQAVKDEADAQLEIAKLRNEAVKRDKYTAQERLNFLQQAADKEREIAETRKEIAKREYELIRDRNAMSESSTEDLDKEAQAYAAMVNAERDYVQNTIRLQSQMAQARKEIADETKKMREERQKQSDAILKEYQDFMVSIIEDETEREYQLRQLEGQREIAELRERLRVEQNITAEAREALNDLIKRKEDELQRDLAMMRQKVYEDRQAQMEQQLQSMYDALPEIVEEEEEAVIEPLNAAQQRIVELMKEGIDYATAQKIAAQEMAAEYADAAATISGSMSMAFNALSDLLGEYSDENEEAARASKAFALVGIIADQAQAISSGVKAMAEAVAGATAAGAATGIAAPITTPVFIATMTAQVASMMASIIGGIVSAKKVLSGAKFANGGVVGGTSYSGDLIPARLNSGEVVLNQKQAANTLYQIANTPASIGYDLQVQAFSAALRQMPAPVMIYSEFGEFQNKVATYNELAAI